MAKHDVSFAIPQKVVLSKDIQPDVKSERLLRFLGIFRDSWLATEKSLALQLQERFSCPLRIHLGVALCGSQALVSHQVTQH